MEIAQDAAIPDHLGDRPVYLIVPGRGSFLEGNITLVNQDPYGLGWLYAVKGEPDPACFDAHAYSRLLDDTIDKLLKQP